MVDHGAHTENPPREVGDALDTESPPASGASSNLEQIRAELEMSVVNNNKQQHQISLSISHDDEDEDQGLQLRPRETNNTTVPLSVNEGLPTVEADPDVANGSAAPGRQDASSHTGAHGILHREMRVDLGNSLPAEASSNSQTEEHRAQLRVRRSSSEAYTSKPMVPIQEDGAAQPSAPRPARGGFLARFRSLNASFGRSAENEPIAEQTFNLHSVGVLESEFEHEEMANTGQDAASTHSQVGSSHTTLGPHRSKPGSRGVSMHLKNFLGWFFAC